MSENSTLKTSSNFDEYPEITQADFEHATVRKGLKPVDKKQRITIMLDAGIVSYFKAQAGKRGYQTLINDTLKKAIDQNGFEKQLRRIIREELNQATHAH